MYVKIKNAIIALLITVMYMGWTVDGIPAAKLVIACICVFFSMFGLLETADEEYLKFRRKRKSA